MAYKIEFERERCMGCGACTQCDNWEMSDDGKVSPIKTELEEIGCNQDAAGVCPIDIITVTEVS